MDLNQRKIRFLKGLIDAYAIFLAQHGVSVNPSDKMPELSIKDYERIVKHYMSLCEQLQS